MAKDLELYQWFESLGWPRSYAGKAFLVAFVVIQVPMIALIVYILLTPHESSRLSLLILLPLATLLGGILVISAFKLLLEPVKLAREALDSYVGENQVIPLPTHFRDEVGSLLSNIAKVIQIFEIRRSNLEQIAVKDYLTGLLNRRAGVERLQHSLDLSFRNELPLCIAVADVDYFKNINDNYGHAIGDRVLIALSESLQQIVRGSDWVARWGGEEFLIVLYTDLEGAKIALERIREGIAQLKVSTGLPDNSELTFTTSIGFTLAIPNDTIYTSVERADKALYTAKREGRNQVIHFTGEWTQISA
ncbi:GGDEF domain-containing protein [Tumidithrix elongata RA019]|uniref:GGDEF domain-containing protein n=1 Tax=Tumidithrix elongata BACA0141 TaxID=2716417 RepID=A0AAW9PV39_9CYAN|nr:GGDEF domain-containing protein [Tumidithrix elongata RA019]